MLRVQNARPEQTQVNLTAMVCIVAAELTAGAQEQSAPAGGSGAIITRADATRAARMTAEEALP
jgi:hypothetical protein